MVQFGAGAALAAQCPVAPIPDGWQQWTDANGPVPDGLAQRAQAIAADQSIALGTTESYPLPGVTTLIRVEPHAWSRDTQGALVQGCFRTGVIYLPVEALPADAVTPPTSADKLTKTVGILTAVSLAVGTLATVAAWPRK